MLMLLLPELRQGICRHSLQHQAMCRTAIFWHQLWTALVVLRRYRISTQNQLQTMHAVTSRLPDWPLLTDVDSVHACSLQGVAATLLQRAEKTEHSLLAGGNG
jgi:hypothetical protein